MRRNLKFHTIAIVSIVSIVTVLFFWIGPDLSVPESEQARGDRYIQIYNATWGTNCNPYINAAMKAQKQQSLKGKAQPQENNTIAPDAPIETDLKPATLNNVLTAVSDRCNGRLACDMLVTSENLGLEPMVSCFKRLLVSYRCFELDRLWNLDLGQGENLVINCRTDADEASGRVRK